MAPIGKPRRKIRRPIPEVQPKEAPETDRPERKYDPIFVPHVDEPAIPVPNWPGVPVVTPKP